MVVCVPHHIQCTFVNMIIVVVTGSEYLSACHVRTLEHPIVKPVAVSLILAYYFITTHIVTMVHI